MNGMCFLWFFCSQNLTSWHLLWHSKKNPTNLLNALYWLGIPATWHHCPPCRTSLIATRFWVVVICPIIKCLTVLEFYFILFDLCLFITIFNLILNYVPIVTFWIFTYHKNWILLIIFCFIWNYWITVKPLTSSHPKCCVKVASQKGWPLMRGGHCAIIGTHVLVCVGRYALSMSWQCWVEVWVITHTFRELRAVEVPNVTPCSCKFCCGRYLHKMAF